jgi:hypothetical protein
MAPWSPGVIVCWIVGPVMSGASVESLDDDNAALTVQEGQRERLGVSMISERAWIGLGTFQFSDRASPSAPAPRAAFPPPGPK